jgi:hypothetical protein
MKIHKTAVISAAVAVTMIAAFCVTLVFAANSARTYTIDTLVGSVQVSADSGSTWNDASVGTPVTESMLVKTGSSSYCDITMPKRGTLRVTENSQVLISKLAAGVEQVKVQKGKGLFDINQKLKDNESFQVESSVAVAAVRGTEFAIAADDENFNIQVVKGRVAVRRNVNIPNVDALDPDTKKLLEVDTSAGQEATLTMDENRHLEDLISRAKGDLQEMKQILQSDNKVMLSKVKLAKNAKRLFDMMNEDENQNGNTNDEDDDIIGKVNSRLGK